MATCRPGERLNLDYGSGVIRELPSVEGVGNAVDQLYLAVGRSADQVDGPRFVVGSALPAIPRGKTKLIESSLEQITMRSAPT